MNEQDAKQALEETPNMDVSIPSSKPTHNIPLLLVFLGVFGIFIIVILGVFFFLSQQNNVTTSQENFVVPSITSTQTPSGPSMLPSESQQDYKTRYFDVNDNFWGKEKYPSELTQISDTTLIPLLCSHTYSGYGKDYSSFDDVTQQSIPLTDSTLLSYIQRLHTKYKEKEVREIFMCTSKQEKPIVVYSLGPCGGGCMGIPYLGIVNESGITEIAPILDTTAYFGCRKPLQMTSDTFYFECDGADGPGASKSLNAFSLSNRTISKIKQCNSGIDESQKPFSRCE